MVFPWLEIFSDTIVDAEDLEAELDDWDAGRIEFVGQTFALEWLGPDESRKLVVSEFGF
jgi:hypothetical protein